MATENSRLKRQLAIQAEELEILKKRQHRDEHIKLVFDNSKQRDGVKRIKVELE